MLSICGSWINCVVYLCQALPEILSEPPRMNKYEVAVLTAEIGGAAAVSPLSSEDLFWVGSWGRKHFFFEGACLRTPWRVFILTIFDESWVRGRSSFLGHMPSSIWRAPLPSSFRRAAAAPLYHPRIWSEEDNEEEEEKVWGPEPFFF